MPTTTSLTTTYAGELAGEIVAKALLSNVSAGYVTMKPNVPYKSVVRKIDDTVTFAAGTCDFTPTGTITLTERILTLEEFQVQRQICKKDFFTDWTTADVMSGRVNTQIQDAIIGRLVGGIAAAAAGLSAGAAKAPELTSQMKQEYYNEAKGKNSCRSVKYHIISCR